MIPGPTVLPENRCVFLLWAPLRKSVDVFVDNRRERIPLTPVLDGYWTATLSGVSPGMRYRYLLDGETERPDPASRFQPEGVHGPSEIVDGAAFPWGDSSWRGIPPERMIMYEIHVGTFTPEGTFDGVIGRLNDLSDLGVNALEIMPVAQFPGERNWGYDGVFPYAVQNSYGGPEGLRRLVDACHARGFAVILDVVYNHLGPEGNYLREFGPYFTSRYDTPWGEAVNFDGPYSDEVRNYFIENALYWLREFHMDALRLDAVHGVYDLSAYPFLAELNERVAAWSRESGRPVCLIAESDLNDTKVIRSRDMGGYGFDAQWNDGYHHALHTLITGERTGYYTDYGKIAHLVKSLREGFIVSGQFSSYRKRRHGNSSRDIPPRKFIVFSQNHDQVGNRMLGERLSALVSFEALKLAAGAVILSPYIPLLFMGEEYGEEAPFLYFVSHTDPELAKAVNEGRKREFAEFLCQGEAPAPGESETFFHSKVRWENRGEGKHAVLLRFYRDLIRLRKTVPAFANLDREGVDVSGDEQSRIVLLLRSHPSGGIMCIMNFSEREAEFRCGLPEGQWKIILDSSDAGWMGPGSLLPERLEPEIPVRIRPHCIAVYEREKENG
ncbi:MAG: malto-oligosyltrehalose trehalohydrolase [Candidatus Latescibacterota bacterium]